MYVEQGDDYSRTSARLTCDAQPRLVSDNTSREHSMANREEVRKPIWKLYKDEERRRVSDHQ